MMQEADEWSGEELQKLQERLISDSSLRDALTDDEAQQLLDWGLAQLRRELRHAAALPSPEARSQLEAQVGAVRQVMRQANRMVRGLPGATKGERREHLLHFLEGLRDAGARSVQAEALIDLEKTIMDQETTDSEVVFRHLLGVMRDAVPEDEEE